MTDTNFDADQGVTYDPSLIAHELTDRERQALVREPGRDAAHWAAVIQEQLDAGEIWVSPSLAAGGQGRAMTLGELVEFATREENYRGFTVASQIVESEIERPRLGFPVAMACTELKEDGSRTYREMAKRRVRWYLAIEPLLELLGVNLGGWLDIKSLPALNTYEFNITVVFFSLNDFPRHSQIKAELFAIAHNQKAIFNLASGNLIRTFGSGETEWIDE